MTSAIVIDNGTHRIRAGFAGEENPAYSFPSMVSTDSNNNQVYVGMEAQEKRNSCTPKYPIEYGMINQWEGIEAIWNHIFTKLQKTADQQPVFMIGAPSQATSSREKITEILFETFNVPSTLTAAGELMSLYESGKTEGLVINCGATFRVVPVYDGFILPHSVLVSHFGGRDITDYLCRLVDNKLGTELSYREKHSLAEIIKTSKAWVSDIFLDEKNQRRKEEYILPDGRSIILNNEVMQCTEAFFNPSLIGKQETEGLQHLLLGVISSLRCDIDIRTALVENIMLVGGSANIPGFQSRFEKELNKNSPKGMRYDYSFQSVDHPDMLPWKGGSILASLDSFENSWFTKAQYDEDGPAGIHTNALFG